MDALEKSVRERLPLYLSPESLRTLGSRCKISSS